MTALKLSLLLAPLLLADVGARQGNTYIGPVRDIDSLKDGGLFMTRDGGEPIGRLSCIGATALETGCVTPGTQSFNGNKTHNGDQRIVGHVHGSLTACAAGTKGNWQTCTTHNSPVFCNGTTNIELLGSTSLMTLATLQLNRMFHALNGYGGAFTLPYPFTITTASGIIGTGVGTTITLRFTDGTNNCDCSIDCATGAISACTGSCTYAASTQVLATPNADGCTTPLTIYGALTVTGYGL